MIATMGLTLKALKKEPFSGSHHGMRYYLNSSEEGLKAWVYPEPWCFERTPEEDKISKSFSFNQEGLDAAVDWINETFKARQDQWELAEKTKMQKLLG